MREKCLAWEIRTQARCQLQLPAVNNPSYYYHLFHWYCSKCVFLHKENIYLKKRRLTKINTDVFMRCFVFLTPLDDAQGGTQLSRSTVREAAYTPWSSWYTTEPGTHHENCLLPRDYLVSFSRLLNTTRVLLNQKRDILIRLNNLRLLR